KGNREQINNEKITDNATGKEIERKVVSKVVRNEVATDDFVKEENFKTHVVSDSGTKDGEKVVTKNYVSERESHLGGVNEHRKNNGSGEVSLNPVLNRMAEEKAKHMSDNDYFSHDFPDGTKLESQFEHFFDTFLAEDGTRLGENIVRIYVPEENHENFNYLFNRAFEMWIDSPGHNTNMASDMYKDMGVGMYVNRELNTAHVVQILANRNLELTMSDIGEKEEVIAGTEVETPAPSPEPEVDEEVEEDNTPTPEPTPEVEEDEE